MIAKEERISFSFGCPEDDGWTSSVGTTCKTAQPSLTARVYVHVLRRDTRGKDASGIVLSRTTTRRDFSTVKTRS